MEKKKFSLKTIGRAIRFNRIKLLIITILSLIVGCTYSGLSTKKTYSSTSDLLIRKVCEPAVLTGICEIVKSDDILIETINEIKEKEITFLDESTIKMDDIKNGLSAHTIMSKYQIFIVFKCKELSVSESINKIIVDKTIEYISKNNRHYHNNIESVNYLSQVEKIPNFSAFKIIIVLLYALLISISIFTINEYFNPLIHSEKDLSNIPLITIERKTISSFMSFLHRKTPTYESDVNQSKMTYIYSLCTKKTNKLFINHLLDSSETESLAIIYLTTTEKAQNEQVQANNFYSIIINTFDEINAFEEYLQLKNKIQNEFKHVIVFIDDLKIVQKLNEILKDDEEKIIFVERHKTSIYLCEKRQEKFKAQNGLMI